MAGRRGRHSEQAVEELAARTERHQELETQKIRADEQRRGAERELEQLEKQALEEHGTADLTELEQRLAELEARNVQLRAEYQQHLDDVEKRLDEVAREHEAALEEDD